jgi:hypothetical protein
MSNTGWIPALACRNLSSQELHEVIPWEVALSPEAIAASKQPKKVRSAWLQKEDTNHVCYTYSVGQQSNLRVSKANPPVELRGVVADIDLALTIGQATELVSKLRLIPQFLERSLGGNLRLVWVFERPVRVPSFSFAREFLSDFLAFSGAETFPGLDKPAATNPSQVYALGLEWLSSGQPPVAWTVVQSRAIEVAKRKQETSPEVIIPIEAVEARIKELFPTFTWPGPFVYGSQGPSWWIPGSTSPKSAIVKPDGMYTFSAHAEKPWWPWEELLGKDWVAQYTVNNLAERLSNIFFDGRLYFYQIPSGAWVSVSKEDLVVDILRGDCGLSAKPGPDGLSPVEQALRYIRTQNRVHAAAPFLFRPKGLISFNGKRFVNTASIEPLQPAEGHAEWGEHGNFPFLSRYFEHLFDDSIQSQLDFFLCWLRIFYESALAHDPKPGQICFLAGGTGVGKTFLGRVVMAEIFGGAADVTDFLLGTDSFNSDLIESPVWCMDDDAPSSAEEYRLRYMAILKKVAANQSMRYHKKHESAALVEWSGRLLVTCNLDWASARALPQLDENNVEKIHLFLAAKMPRIQFFESRNETLTTVRRELPFFLNWLLYGYQPGKAIRLGGRYGMNSFHAPQMVRRAMQTSDASPVLEVVRDYLVGYFKNNPEETRWQGSTSILLKSLATVPGNDFVLRHYRVSTLARLLEQGQRFRLLPCSVNAKAGTRIWSFKREDFQNEGV